MIKFLPVTTALLLCVFTTHASYRARFRAKKLACPSHVVFKIDDKQAVLGDTFMQKCKDQFRFLNDFNGSYFNTAFLKQTESVRSFLHQQPQGADKGIPLVLSTCNGAIHATFFDRNSKYLILICGGFTNAREYMTPFVKLFPQYDLVFFDLPGHGLDKQVPITSKGLISDSLCGINTEVITLGQSEAEVIQVVTSYFKKRTYYKKTCAVARCYSVPFFAQAAVSWQNSHVAPLFDALIIDSAFPSFASFVPNFPSLFCSAFNAPLLNDMSQTWLVKKGFYYVAEFFLSKDLSTCPSVASLLNQLVHTDMLFFHSLKDVAISEHDFYSIWNELSAIENKAAVFTYNRHAMNHIKQKELYAYITQAFVEKNFQAFTGHMINA